MNLEFEKQIAKERTEQMLRCIPDFFRLSPVLYVGANKDRKMFVDEFVENGAEIDVVEVFLKNVEYLNNVYVAKNKIRRVIHSSILDMTPDSEYELTVWYHGPEHMDKSKVQGILERLQKYTKVLVVGTPIGIYIQGPVDGNENERHVSAWEMVDFAKMGFKVDQIGVSGHGVNSVLAWKRK